MADAALLEGRLVEAELDPIASGASRTPFSWSAAIAGALAAMAVSFLTISLGSGIGLSFATPYGSGPSATSLTVAAAVWLVMAQAMGFATGGYLAGRLRSPAYDGIAGETTFRDAAQGLVVWAIGVVVSAALLIGLTMFAARTTAQVAGIAAAPSSASQPTTTLASATDYFVDLMFRPAPNVATAGPPGQPQSDTVGAASSPNPPLNADMRAEVSRILARAVSRGSLDDIDRAYLAQVVSTRTGLPADEAQRRVVMVETNARQAVKDAADKTAKAGAFFSFWTFMSLLFGGVAATLGGMLGGELRDAEGRLAMAAR